MHHSLLFSPLGEVLFAAQHADSEAGMAAGEGQLPHSSRVDRAFGGRGKGRRGRTGEEQGEKSKTEQTLMQRHTDSGAPWSGDGIIEVDPNEGWACRLSRW
jgi:hypothetical protein